MTECHKRLPEGQTQIQQEMTSVWNTTCLIGDITNGLFYVIYYVYVRMHISSLFYLKYVHYMLNRWHISRYCLGYMIILYWLADNNVMFDSNILYMWIHKTMDMWALLLITLHASSYNTKGMSYIIIA